MKRSAAAAAVAFATASIFPAFAETSALDGRSFEGVFIQKGKTSGDADTLIFKDGRFRSIACDRYGYSDAVYRTASAGDSMRFEAETQSAKYGKLLWSGEVRGGKLDATATMVRDGKSNIENWVVASEKN
ncbi:MAG TPA: hypothetical protein VLL50_07100 [Usitatibacter sp.]|nr:hypothetical protein [Usitatibacter sp.]